MKTVKILILFVLLVPKTFLAEEDFYTNETPTTSDPSENSEMDENDNNESDTKTQLLLPNEYFQENLQTLPCIKVLFSKYFNTGQEIGGSIVIVSINRNDSYYQERLLDILNNEPAYYWTIMIKDSSKKHLRGAHVESEEKARNYLMLIETSDEVTDIVDQWKAFSTRNPLAQVLSLFTRELDRIILDANTVGVISMLLRSNVLNANVMSQTFQESSMQVSTLFPYKEETCADQISYIQVVDVCEYNSTDEVSPGDNIMDIYEESNDLSDKFPKDLHGCPLRAAARIWEPFTSYDPKFGFEMGIDVRLMETVASYFNLSLILNANNQTIYHLYQQLLDDDIHLIIGGIDKDPSMNDILSSSIPYYQDDLTWCVKRAEQIVLWTNLFSIIDFETVYTLSIIWIICASVMYYFAQSRTERVDSFFISFGLILSLPVTFETRSTLQSYFFMNFVLLGFCLSMWYQTFLISILTTPSLVNQISTLQHIYDNEMDVTGGLEVIRHLSKKDTVTEYLRKNLKLCYNIEKCLAEVTHNTNLAVAVSRQHAMHNPRVQRDKIFCFSTEENVYSYLVSILTTKNYHLLERFNRVIRYVTEAGLIDKWKNDLNNFITIKEIVQRHRLVGNIRDDSPLTFEQLMGGFIVGGAMLCLAFLVFCFENFIYFMVFRRGGKSSKFWIRLHNMLS